MKNPIKKFSVVLLFVIFSCSSGDSEGEAGVPLNNLSLITRFELANGEIGAINNTDNTIFGRDIGPNQDITNVTPIIAVSAGATVVPASGVSQDFTNPITYTVTAEDGSTTNYVVTVEGTIFSFTFDQTTYEIVSEELTWEDAAAYAVARGGQLAEINSSEENGAITSQLVNNPEMDFMSIGLQAVWIGGNDFGNEGVWIFDGDNDGNGTQFWDGGIEGMAVDNAFANWNPAEPDNLMVGSGTENALALAMNDPLLPDFFPGQWCDIIENSTMFFVIETNN